jgi:3-oxoacyl-[acyl-carrier-protein] synthase II
MSRDVYITGLGIVSPIGVGKTAFLDGLRSGRCALGRLSGLDPAEFRIGRGAEVDDTDLTGEGLDLDGSRCLALALHACREALADAGLAGTFPEDATLALGSGAGEMRAVPGSLGAPQADLPLEHADPLQPPNSVTSKLAGRLGLRGRQITFVNACAAGAQAIAVAADLIRTGRAEVALAGGVEIMSRMVLSGFEALRAISPTGVHPFDAERDGVQLSEIAAFLVLESGDRVRERAVHPCARFAGSGASADAFHVVQPHAGGAGAVLALRRALADAALEPGDIDYVNAHGTGTPQNDGVELAALGDVFGERLASVPVSSTKGMLGHALAASGAAEAAICALALREHFLPPTVGLRTRIEGYEAFDFVPQAREGVQLRHVVSSAFAFGGNNVVIVLSAP